jgi:Zn-dependent protease with chaperone function
LATRPAFGDARRTVVRNGGPPSFVFQIVAMMVGHRPASRLTPWIIVIGLAATTWDVSAQRSVSQATVELGSSYAEWKFADALVVDGQKVVVDASTKWKGKFKSIAAVPLGHEVRVKGVRQTTGDVLAREIDVRANGTALFEPEVLQGSNELEGLWIRNRTAFEADGTGRKVEIGAIHDSGPRVDRVRGILRRVSPPYVDESTLRVYVIDNKEWNAMAMGNGAIWVFSGIMDDMSDPELAVVVGHELAHYTHEHSRRQARKGMWIQMAGLATLAAAEAIDHDGWRAVAQVSSLFGFTAWMSGYGRSHEDQADRVGLRYAYEGGYDVSQAPRVWQRFLDKYGEGDRLTNFFFSDHSTASARRKNLEEEIRLNRYVR